MNNLTADEAAARIGVTRKHLLYLTHMGYINAIHIPTNTYVFKPEDVETFLRRQEGKIRVINLDH